MNNTKFYKTFKFIEFRIRGNHHTDARNGASQHYLGYLKSGKATIVTEKKSLELVAGDLFYIPFGASYQSYWSAEYDEEVRWDSFGFLYFPNPEEKTYTLQKIKYSKDEYNLLCKLSSEKRANLVGVSDLYALLARIMPHMEISTDYQKNSLLKEATYYLTEHINCSVTELSQYCKISESGLYAAFKRNCNCTPNELRQKIKIEKAINLLTTTDISIEEISDSLGYSSSSYFRKILRKLEGKTPSQIRKEHFIV